MKRTADTTTILGTTTHTTTIPTGSCHVSEGSEGEAEGAPSNYLVTDILATLHIASQPALENSKVFLQVHDSSAHGIGVELTNLRPFLDSIAMTLWKRAKRGQILGDLSGLPLAMACLAFTS